MSRPIKYLLLQKSELSYEVAIRGEIPSDNVEGLRRQVNKLTQLYASDDILDTVYDFPTDIEGCSTTLDKIKSNLDSLIVNYSESLYNRTKSLINHLHYRIQRIEKPVDSENKISLEKVIRSFENYNAVLKGFSLPSTSESKISSPPTVGEENNTEKSNVSGLNISVTCDRSSSEINKIKFDGKSCVRAFIQKIEEYRTSKGHSESKMLLSAIDIFTGDALHWFRSVKNELNDWQTLISRLKEDFDVPDFDYRMLAEIRDRTQGTGEGIVVYLSIMDGMFSRLSRSLTNEDKLDIILHNIHPSYSTIIAASPNIKSVDDLRTVCKNYECIKVRSENYKEPPNISSKLLAPEFCYQSQRRKDNGRNYYGNSSNPTNAVKIEDQPNSVHAIARPYCARCRVNTHSLRECTAERTIICFGCGEEGVRRPDCPKCNKVKTGSKSLSKN